jgi:hypothetical protein
MNRPRGRAPRGKVWDYTKGRWVDDDREEMQELTKDLKKEIKELNPGDSIYPSQTKIKKMGIYEFISLHKVEDFPTTKLYYDKYRSLGGKLTWEEFCDVFEE